MAPLVGLCVTAGVAFAQEFPRPPCGSPPEPVYPEVGVIPNVRVIAGAALKPWGPPACVGWSLGERGTVVALSGSFASRDADEVLRRFAEVSKLRGLRYWSVSDRNWRALISDAAALTGADAKTRRVDFSLEELKTGAALYFVQSDTRSSGEVMYRMRVREASRERVVMETENVSAVRALVLTLFAPGELKALYFFERRSDGSWGYYALNAVLGRDATGNEASLINRAAAYHRHLTGAAADGAPPLAP